ncbi:putative transcription antitermination regulator [Nocardia neocaledoniensis NBRC 108232]|uniref:histidine kinase n=1 Tax=Nocardia neocaledoniensis TaxID=236511 RepID=A0A317P2C7_9NOCA|nr:PAS and ANTAR domain-containing protein [Nocardia neocaledoniensis]PWV81521.1 PAS domain-containing protein [Nocardia neocaledoniensis]GEM32155.1 putative transcription antitermination regulator [Nocardia neocaledoniensis NBRC 108232]
MTESDSAQAGHDDERFARAYRPAHVGTFTFWFTTGRWEWSPEVYRMHGYVPGEIEPTTELLLSHKHPDDRDVVAGLIDRTIAEGAPFSSRHRFLDTAGRVHAVMVLADRVLDDHGEPVATTGYYLDLSDTVDAAAATAAGEAVGEAMTGVVAARAVIEQAKGVLMRMYRIDADQAFKVLVWRSQEANIKLRDIAAQVIADLKLVPPPPPETLTAFDHLLLTSHERIDPDRNT